jgi:hypothetical protein
VKLFVSGAPILFLTGEGIIIVKFFQVKSIYRKKIISAIPNTVFHTSVARDIFFHFIKVSDTTVEKYFYIVVSSNCLNDKSSL